MTHQHDCDGPPYCNHNPFEWGNQPDGYTYPDQLGPGGQAHLRYAQTMTDGYGYTKQLGQLPQICPSGQIFNMSTLQCEPEPEYPPGYDPPPDMPEIGPNAEPGGVMDRPCTYYEKMIGVCPPSGNMPSAVPPVSPPSGELPGGAIPEQLCRDRETDAYAKGQAAAQGDVIRTAAISAAVSAAVGLALGYMLTESPDAPLALLAAQLPQRLATGAPTSGDRTQASDGRRSRRNAGMARPSRDRAAIARLLVRGRPRLPTTHNRAAPPPLLTHPARRQTPSARRASQRPPSPPAVFYVDAIELWRLCSPKRDSYR